METNFRPRCPECNTPLIDCGFPLPAKGQGTCPVGNCMVSFEAETDSSVVSKDKDGKIIKKRSWRTHLGGTHN